MKTIWNDNWLFTKEAVDPAASTTAAWENVTIPHTWNGVDGQDGDDDYYRGTCWYRKTLTADQLTEDKDTYLEFAGTFSIAAVYVNGKKAGEHEGGFSTWRVNVSEFVEAGKDADILVSVDNAPNDRVYPQRADFTFYGGMYRNVYVIRAAKKRFDLDYIGGPGVKVTPIVKEDGSADVTVEVYTSGLTGGETLEYIIENDGVVAASQQSSVSAPEEDTKVVFTIAEPHLWNGRKDPHLYTAKVTLKDQGETLDGRTVRFGIRSFKIDPEKGFILNGESYPLRGVSRHQDRPGIGNALLPEHHKEDIDLIMEVGATTIRLAHYQHDQFFYDLCDENGLVIWAEIPYISQHMPNGRSNTVSQMKELITQNYNHPCIVVWGLSNEITMNGDKDPDLLENHRILNDLCHSMDKTRLTTLAALSMTSMDSEYLHIPDVVSYNHYYGWYGGDTSMNAPFMDKFHAKYPDFPIGMSEYGAEAPLNWHSSNPEQADYTEEYQAYYHEELIKALFTRPFVWATHCWNMFDFGADARSEGGEDGQNHKGLVNFDRTYKKDAFYAYKAWLSDEPFVHICGKRYVDRVEEVTKVTVYSNQPEVELFVNGESLGKQTKEDHFFYFQVPNKGESTLTAKAGECSDESTLRKVEVFNEAYRMKESGDVINWFDITAPEGYFSINDKLGEILFCVPSALIFAGLLKKLMGAAKKDNEKGENKEAAKEEKNGAPKTSGFELNDNVLNMLNGFTMKRMLSMIGMAGAKPLSKEETLELNAKLNKVRKPKPGSLRDKVNRKIVMSLIKIVMKKMKK